MFGEVNEEAERADCENIEDSDVEDLEEENGLQVVNEQQLNELLTQVRINCLNECTHYKKKWVKINVYVIKMLEKVQSNYFK